MAACKIDPTASPQFVRLCNHWKNHGYPSVQDDLADAFCDIRKNILAKHGRVVPRFSAVLGGDVVLYKYRQKNSQAREGARGGWRIYALFQKTTSILYPVIVYPKKEWDDATDDTVKNALEQILSILSKPPDLF